MNKKAELIKVFKEYKVTYETLQAQVQEINKSESYTQVGREAAVSKLLGEFAPVVEMYRNRAIDIIDTGVDALAEKWRKNSTGKLMDSGYQAGLANVMKMLEMGAVKEREDIKNIIDNYAGDFNALAVLREILLKSKNKALHECVSLVPLDNREKNKELLAQLKGNVHKYINISAVQSVSRSWNMFNQGLTSVSMSMDSMAQFVQDRLGDNLELMN